MRSIDLQMAFSLNKQADIATALGAADIDRMLPYNTFAPSTQEFPDALSDKDYYGKGHSFATWWDPVTQQVVMGNREYSLSNLSALFAPAMVMGKVASVQPNSTTAPTVWDHTFSFQDPLVNEEVVYTSMIEKMGSVYQRLITGAFLEQFSLTGNLRDHVKIGWNGAARKFATDVSVLPTLTATSSFFITNNATFTFDGANVSAKTLSWQLQVLQNPSRFWLPGNVVGEEKQLSKVKVGKQGATGSITLLLEDATQKDKFESNEECSLVILLKGALITGIYYHQVTITIPHFKIPSESFGEEQDQTTYTLPFTEQSILKAPGSEYLSITVRGTEDDTALLVQGA